MQTLAFIFRCLVLLLFIYINAEIAIVEAEEDNNRTNIKDPTDKGFRYIDINNLLLNEVLWELAKTFDINLIYSKKLLVGQEVISLVGVYSIDEALRKVLHEKNIVVSKINKNTYALKEIKFNQIDNVAKKTQNRFMRKEFALEELVVTGAKAKERSLHNSLAPIDIIARESLLNTSSQDLGKSLAQIIPSYTDFNFPLNDGLIFNPPSGLRGLNMEHTLVLVNGKRLHRSAFLESFTGHSTDITVLPKFALEKVEVLRDGASAQYGSGAIGGVLNFRLDENIEDEAYLAYSERYEGDGETIQAGIKLGWQWGENDFLVLTQEYYDAGMTSRSRQREDAILFQQNTPSAVIDDPVQNWGDPDIEGIRTVINSGFEISDSLNGYSIAVIGVNEGSANLNWRNPDRVNAYDTSQAFPQFDLRDIYPAGFTPELEQKTTDLFVVAGLTNEFSSSGNWDVSLTYGYNEIRYDVANSINASLGPNSPTDFYAGKLNQQELTLSFNYGSALGFSLVDEKQTKLLFGSEVHSEWFRVGAGEEASFVAGPGAIDGLPSASNGFPGYTEQQAGSYSQYSFAAFAEIETSLTENTMFALALRDEYYQLYGNNLSAKASLLYRFNDDFSVRGTWSNGFRAPTSGQYFSDRTTQSLINGSLDVTTSGRLSPQHELAKIVSLRPDVDIRSLEIEKSNSYTLGMAYQFNEMLAITADYYSIELRDRVGRTDSIDLTEMEIAELNNIIGNDANINSISFFQNIFATQTRGVDVVMTWDKQFHTSKLSAALAYNYNTSNLKQHDFDEIGRIYDVSGDRVPKHKVVFDTLYQIGDFKINGRVRYFSSWRDITSREPGTPIQTFSSHALFDLGLSYQLNETLGIKVGANNLFNSYPDEAELQRERGLIYSRHSPYDVNGGQYYLQTGFNF